MDAAMIRLVKLVHSWRKCKFKTTLIVLVVLCDDEDIMKRHCCDVHEIATLLCNCADITTYKGFQFKTTCICNSHGYNQDTSSKTNIIFDKILCKIVLASI